MGGVDESGPVSETREIARLEDTEKKRSMLNDQRSTVKFGRWSLLLKVDR
ncbi:hypothetical protein Poly59_42310 [Rubripirellula reticaptiva]|uniref:Uncharacterized protein n=1 Tax=Rubripirellula reticaptiva TaxID=2528013 RepID=A0A5C6EMI5_9BACT|nr:hypothetical protein Poly59_42310 [Rubripirellula reticaptiva]